MKLYRVREGAPAEVRSALSNHSEFLQDMLYARGVTTGDAAAQFLAPEFDRDSHDPYLLPDMEKSVDRILSALKNNEKVCVWSDYDCDGIPGGVMLTDFLRKLGLNVRHYIPHRHKEGYGLNKDGLDDVIGDGVTLLITIDLGTVEHENISHAKSKGVDVIVTDHHLVHTVADEEPADEKVLGSPVPAGGQPCGPDYFAQQVPHLPVDAFAVINPKRPDSAYPFDGLCGCGVAWKLVQALLVKVRASGQPFDFAQGREKWYLDLVGISTLSDMVPLVGENRMLARFGLLVMRKNRRPGLAQLLSILKIKPGTLTEDDIGFMVSPRINAASRMDSPDVAAKLLATSDLGQAFELAHKLNGINDERKSTVAVTVKEVNKRLAASEVETPIIVMGNPNWRPGILGLVANSVMQSTGKVAFMWGREWGDVVGGLPRETGGLLRGSCRSNGKVNVVELMQAAGDVFAGFGGHTASGGFSVLEERIHELAPRLNAAFALLPEQVGESEVIVDRQLDLAEVSRAHKELTALAPFGVENTKPLFIFPNVSIQSVRTFGKQKDHLEVTCERDSVTIGGVSFFSTPDSYQKKVKAGDRADVIGHVETDWRGGPRLRIVDII